MLPRYDEAELKTAHDVRRLVPCQSCSGIGMKPGRHLFGESRGMLTGLEAAGLEPGWHHSRCVVMRLTAEQVLALPREERAKLTLKDTGKELMFRLLDAVETEDCEVQEPSSLKQ